jgi:hypothetical protein
MPPGIPPDMAIEFMAKLKAGSTIGKLTTGKYGPSMVSYERFKKHCELHPAWAAEAWRISRVIRGALAADDALKAQGQETRFRVRETPDWQRHAGELESEMLKRGMFFDVIDWSEDQGNHAR